MTACGPGSKVDRARSFALADYGGDDDYVAAVIVHPWVLSTCTWCPARRHARNFRT
jgi:hypothetical protein